MNYAVFSSLVGFLMQFLDNELDEGLYDEFRDSILLLSIVQILQENGYIGCKLSMPGYYMD